ncbi:MAG: hypothetical protein SOR93_06505 [Clostridiales Family XIII bacterium]|nr:hypothetical protein [Clostridia bacterium]MDY3010905.1 hypothetical protein [Clostridiales Family XIII bacterium]
MATKKVYFYAASLTDGNEKKFSNEELKAKLTEIIERNGHENGEYRSVDISPPSEPLHMVLDVFKYKEDRLFCRISKQKLNSSVIQREYTTFKKEDVLPSGTERKNGIELYTFGVLEYSSGIFSIVSAQGAPRIKALSNLFELYMESCKLELISIPNINGIDAFYKGKEPEVSQIEIEVPLPSAATLEHVFGWSNDECLEVLCEQKLRLNVTVKGEPRNPILTGENESRSIVDKIKKGLSGYNKAKLKGKIEKGKSQDYNFFEENFSYPIDIAEYQVENYERVYYTVDELVDLYRQNLVSAYRENEKILKEITGR